MHALHKGENLIFLISQPRAGSTLTQKILGNHPDIHTVSEPWLMLHPFYALSSGDYTANYNATAAYEATKDFFQKLPDGEEIYFEGLRRMYAYIYNNALSSSGKQFFLDKTPRYYYIIPELYRTFPEARFIILLRNPLAVLSSIISTWTKNNWFSLYESRDDLIKAPQLLLQGINLLGRQSLVVHYEQLLLNSENEIKRICDWLNLDFSPEIIKLKLDETHTWKFGDRNVHQSHKPDSKHLEKWIFQLETPQVWRLANDYLQLLGRDTIHQMGYSYEELQHTLDMNCPHWSKSWHTFPLEWLLKKPEAYKKLEYEYYFTRLVKSFQTRGIRGTLAFLLHKLQNNLPHTKQVPEDL